MRRLRAGLVTLAAREAPARPSARTMTGCLQWLDARDTKGGGSRPDGKARKAFPVRPRGSTAYGDLKTPPMERRRGARVSPDARYKVNM